MHVCSWEETLIQHRSESLLPFLLCLYVISTLTMWSGYYSLAHILVFVRYLAEIVCDSAFSETDNTCQEQLSSCYRFLISHPNLYNCTIVWDYIHNLMCVCKTQRYYRRVKVPCVPQHSRNQHSVWLALKTLKASAGITVTALQTHKLRTRNSLLEFVGACVCLHRRLNCWRM